MTQLISDILDRAADLIEPEDTWVKHASATDKWGAPVRICSPDAVCFCAGGAIYRISGSLQRYKPYRFFESHLGAPIPAWNDTPERTQSEVVSKLREAAAKAREAGQ